MTSPSPSPSPDPHPDPHLLAEDAQPAAEQRALHQRDEGLELHPAVAALVEAEVLAQELGPQLDHLGQRRARLGLGRA